MEIKQCPCCGRRPRVAIGKSLVLIDCKDKHHEFGSTGKDITEAAERWNSIVSQETERKVEQEAELREQMRQAASAIRVYLDEMTEQGIPEDKAWKIILTLIKAGQ